VFLGGFDLQAAHAVAGDAGVERYQVLDQLTLLVDKSLLNAETSGGRTRYRLLETVRQYALEKLGESGEADVIGGRHRDYFTSLAAELDAPDRTNHVRRLEQAEIDIDNLRGAFAWSLENGDIVLALRLAASLQPLWFSRWRLKEGLTLLDAALSAEAHTGADRDSAYVRAQAEKGLMLGYIGSTESGQIADEALALARQTADPALVIRALVARGHAYAYETEGARADFAEAIALARELDDRWLLSQILRWQSVAAMSVGDHGAIHAAASEGCELAEALGDASNARLCRVALATAHIDRGEVMMATAPLREVIVEATAAHDVFCRCVALVNLTFALAWQGDVDGAQAAVDEFFNYRSKLGELVDLVGYSAVGLIRLMRGDAPGAHEAYEAALERTQLTPVTVTTYVVSALPLLACGDLIAARRRADDLVTISKDISLVAALAARARVAIAQGEFEQAGDDALQALDVASESHGYMTVPDAFECLAHLAAEASNQREAARLFGMADGARQQTGVARFAIFGAEHERRLAAIRNQLGESDFRAASDEGTSLTIEEAIAYVRRGRGERKRASSGWASLTRAELGVVRLVSEGLGKKDVAARLFVSPRTVQAHLTHIYNKLGLTSRVQLAQEAARRG
jgi:DNA-binding CsgD family transcriptional regulator